MKGSGMGLIGSAPQKPLLACFVFLRGDYGKYFIHSLFDGFASKSLACDFGNLGLNACDFFIQSSYFISLTF